MGFSTNILHYNMIKDFVDSFSSNEYFVFGSSLGNGSTSVNSEYSARLFLEKAIFGKKIQTNDVRFLIRRSIWQSNVVYTQYDDAIDLHTANFFVVIDPGTESGDYDVFKCLSNNYGAVSVEKPQFSEDLSLQNYILNTADGYVWKYMYSVPNAEVRQYGTSTLFPVIPNQSVIADAKQGIDHIVVENPLNNFGYETHSGTIESLNSIDTTEGYRTIFLNAAGFNQIRGYYDNYTFYTTSSDGVTSRKYTIRDSGIRTTDQRPFVSVEDYNVGDIVNASSTVWSYTILPTVEIIGDGTGASAIPILSNSRITSVRILNAGQGYTRSLARIVKPTFGFNPESVESGDVTCRLRVIHGPSDIYTVPGGHGSNAASELDSRHVVVTAQFNSADGSVIPTSNSYSKVGLVKNPLFNSSVSLFDNRIKVELASVAQLTVGDVVTQSTTNFRGVIHTIDSINNFVYVTEFNGPYYDQSENTTFFISNITHLDPTQPLTTPIGRVEIVTDGVTYPVYQRNTGEVLYMSDFDPIQRDDNLAEQFKFIIAF